MKNIGIYIHIPFCKAKCLYCDFCSHVPHGGEQQEYVEQLKKQICSYKDKLRGYTADTIYFGGGTPTIVKTELLCDILYTLSNAVNISADAEITVECNPATASLNSLKQLRGAGFNRISIGAQSFDGGELRALGRLHTAAQFVDTFNDARKAGFDNISLDLMYGIPLQSRKSWAKTLEVATSLAPQHISAYGLRVERATPFGKMGDKLVLPSEDETAQMYLDAVGSLSEAGMQRYEISNFSCQNRESRHNLKYWRCEEYVGFGPAAHSYFEGMRYYAPDEMSRYMSSEWIEAEGACRVSESDAEVEFVMLSMRLREGLEREKYRSRFGVYPEVKYATRFKEFVESGHVAADACGYRFTNEGMLVSNYILSSILDL